MNVNIRKAEKKDVPAIFNLIKELAVFEKAGNEVTNTIESLENDGFGNDPLFEVIIAESNNEIAGMSFYFYSYSTWKGKCLYLEDIIVKMNYRGMGVGKLLFEATIKKAKEINAKRMQWQVLNWNSQAIDFYKKYHAILDNEWINGKLSETQIIEFNS